MTRYLSPAEALLHEHLTTRVVTAWTLRDRVDAGVLARAFHAKLMEHPTLRSTIARDDTGFFLRPLSGELPTVNVLSCSHQEEINTPLSGGALVRATLLRDNTFVLHVHHAIADAHSVTALAGGLLHGSPGGPVVREYPDPIEAHLTPAGDLTGQAPRSLARLPTAGTGTGGTEVEVLALTGAETDRFVERARAEGIGVHGLLCGVLLHELRPHLEPSTGPVGCLSAVDLRGRLALPRERMILAASWHTSVVELTDDPVAMGRAVRDDLRAAIGRGDPERALLAIPHTPPGASVLRPSLSVSNIGRVPTGGAGAWFAAVPDKSFERPGNARLRASVVTGDDGLRLAIAHDPGHFRPGQVRAYLTSVRAALTRERDGQPVERAQG